MALEQLSLIYDCSRWGGGDDSGRASWINPTSETLYVMLVPEPRRSIVLVGHDTPRYAWDSWYMHAQKASPCAD